MVEEVKTGAARARASVSAEDVAEGNELMKSLSTRLSLVDKGRKVTVQLLKDELSRRGLPISGRKLILMRRLCRFFESESTSEGSILATDFIANETDMIMHDGEDENPTSDYSDDSDSDDAMED